MAKPIIKPPKVQAITMRVTPDDLSRLQRLRAKYPEMNHTSLLRRALRELAEREKVA